MSLHDLEVLVLDCQASGATPAHGDLLELGWARVSGVYLERIVVGEGTLVRRAKLLALMSYSQVRFREPRSAERVLNFVGADASAEAPSAPPRRLARIATFDAARYDRLRVLATELKRVATTGGHAEIHIGRHVLRVT